MIGLVILAAGSSTRMGQGDKLLQDLGGRPLFRHALDAAVESKAGPVILVCLNESLVEAQHGYERIIAPEAPLGQSHSLSAGIMALSHTPGVTGALVTLADMPFISADHINAVFSRAQKSPQNIWRAVCGDRPGHPAYWPARYFDQLIALEGDSGAKPLLARYTDSVQTISFSDDSVVFDVDTQASLEEARHRLLSKPDL